MLWMLQIQTKCRCQLWGTSGLRRCRWCFARKTNESLSKLLYLRPLLQSIWISIQLLPQHTSNFLELMELGTLYPFPIFVEAMLVVSIGLMMKDVSDSLHTFSNCHIFAQILLYSKPWQKMFPSRALGSICDPHMPKCIFLISSWSLSLEMHFSKCE